MLFRSLCRLAICLVNRGFQTLGKLGWIVSAPEVHVEEAWGVLEPMVVERGDLDAVLPKRSRRMRVSTFERPYRLRPRPPQLT